MSVEITIALLLLHSPARAYETVFMTSIAMIRSTRLSLGAFRPWRHTTVLTPERLPRVSQVPTSRTSACNVSHGGAEVVIQNEVPALGVSCWVGVSSFEELCGSVVERGCEYC